MTWSKLLWALNQSALLLGNADQRRIELNKSGVHCAVFAVARIAGSGDWNLFRWLRTVAKTEKRPPAREALFILYVHFNADRARLKMPAIVDRAF